MRHFFRMFCLLLIFNHLQVFAQNQNYFCGLTNKEPETTDSNESTCFNVHEVFDKCTPIYVRVNLHFFVGDNCSGKVQQMDKNEKDIYKIAEDVIDEANKTYAYNVPQWQMPGAIAPCNPIRLVLKGIYTHCKSHALGIYNTAELNKEFGVNTSTAINFFIADTEDGASGIGYHSERCGSATAFSKESWWSIGNFVHEMGHILTLVHSFENDGCSDTPIITYDWDKNCNGILEESSDRSLDETNLTCWNKLEANKQMGDPGYSDINHNNVNDCDEQAPCTPCPCCLQEFQDNNVMSYGANKLALTACQIIQMLGDLCRFNCGIIEQIGGCPPASSFITQTQEDQKDQSRCRECLILEASMNEEEYQLKIFEQIGNQEILAYDGGWKKGKATTFCYRTGIAFKGLTDYLKPNTHYIAYLNVRNSCSESNSSYPFITNTGECGSGSIESLLISPNPAFNQLYVKFDVSDESESFQVIAKNMITGAPSTIIQNQPATNGTNQITLDISSLPSGTYTLLFIGEHSIYQNNFVKL